MRRVARDLRSERGPIEILMLYKPSYTGPGLRMVLLGVPVY